MTRQQFWLEFGNIGELPFKCRRDASVKRASRLAEQGAVGSVLYKCVLEQVRRARLDTLPEQQTSCDETANHRRSGIKIGRLEGAMADARPSGQLPSAWAKSGRATSGAQ